jgi:Na+-transporting methylmalonyl-CoA/oxaloacetate decarboxylase gamma subunit
MGIDWGFAGQIGGVGFGLVFVVLIILAIVVWLVGLALKKLSADKDKNKEAEKKGD